MKTHITPFQLFFLTFSYLLSGFFLFSVRSVFGVWAQLALFAAFVMLARPGLSRRRETLYEFVGAFVPGAVLPTVLTALLLVPAVFQMMSTAISFSESAGRTADFLPSWLILAILTGIALFAVWGGMIGAGRFAELLPFLLVPLLCIRPFGGFAPMLSVSDLNALRVLSCVSAAPVFFLAAKTVVPGDEGISDSMVAAASVPSDRASYLTKLLLGAAVSAAVIYGYLMLFAIDGKDVLFRLTLWVLHFIRLTVLVGLAADAVRVVPAEAANAVARRTVFAMVTAASAVCVLCMRGTGDMMLRNALTVLTVLIDFAVPVLLNVFFFAGRRAAVRRKKAREGQP